MGGFKMNFKSGVENLMEWVNSMRNELAVADEQNDYLEVGLLTDKIKYAEKLLRLEMWHDNDERL